MNGTKGKSLFNVLTPSSATSSLSFMLLLFLLPGSPNLTQTSTQSPGSLWSINLALQHLSHNVITMGPHTWMAREETIQILLAPAFLWGDL